MTAFEKLFPLVCLLACGPTEAPSPSTESDLIGGDEAGRQFPATVMLTLGAGLCGAAKIGPRRFLTAAHCVMQTGVRGGQKIRIDFGSPRKDVVTTLTSVKSSEFRLPPKVKTLSELSSESGLDVAVLEVDAETPGAAIATIDRTPLDEDDTIVISGFGCGADQLSDASASPIGTLRYAKVRVESVEEYHVYLPRTDVAGRESRVCMGDSGTPVYKTVGKGKAHTKIVGINSFRSVPHVWGAATRLDSKVPPDANAWLAASGIFDE